MYGFLEIHVIIEAQYDGIRMCIYTFCTVVFLVPVITVIAYVRL